MVFTSVTFVFYFLPVVLSIYLLTNRFGSIKAQNIVLLVASYIFYIWGGIEYSILILVCTIVNYTIGLLMEKYDERYRKRKTVLIFGIIFNIVILGIFKYFNFFANIIEAFIQKFNPEFVMNAPIIPLPIGISFFTFQIMSYIIDVYRRNVPTQHSFIKLALYIMLFPQLIAGPIVRYIDVEKEINNRNSSLDNIYNGMRRFMIGFSKKVILANKMGYMSDLIFAQNGTDFFAYAWLGAISYSLHIFLDFSAYSDMAIGLGEVFGFKFLENFNYPYISSSIQEFWRRWHISLSSWFKDYVYIPLGGNRKGKLRTYINLSTVFLLTGMWHGASWNFIIWGIYHGIFQIIERLGLKKLLDKIPQFLSHIYTLTVVIIGWIFFNSQDLSSSMIYIKNMFLLTNLNWRNIEIMENINVEYIVYLFASICVSIPILKQINCNKWIKDILIMLGFVVSIYYLFVSDFNPFIYFRF